MNLETYQQQQLREQTSLLLDLHNCLQNKELAKKHNQLTKGRNTTLEAKMIEFNQKIIEKQTKIKVLRKENAKIEADSVFNQEQLAYLNSQIQDSKQRVEKKLMQKLLIDPSIQLLQGHTKTDSLQRLLGFKCKFSPLINFPPNHIEVISQGCHLSVKKLSTEAGFSFITNRYPLLSKGRYNFAFKINGKGSHNFLAGITNKYNAHMPSRTGTELLIYLNAQKMTLQDHSRILGSCKKVLSDDSEVNLVFDLTKSMLFVIIDTYLAGYTTFVPFKDEYSFFFIALKHGQSLIFDHELTSK